ncbi:MAG: hypothetical protein BBJ57_02235 [Desulfobacterales bacterium PC51MH44]|nr:MAG: hypothetical protein BBJ57_02235 [Desulfobacterales bacterium PC51MH44]
MDIDALTEGLWIEDYVKGSKTELEQLAKNQALMLAYKSMLDSADGKRVLWDILSFCGVFQNAMTGNSLTYFNLGRQSVGQYIMVALNVGNTFDDVLGFQKLKPEDADGGK